MSDDAPTSILQFEVDRKRFAVREGHNWVTEESIAIETLKDTLVNGGTFVLVVTKDKITIVQRSDAEHP